MFPTIPNDCHPLDDLLWRILGNNTLNVIGDSTKLEAVKVSQGGIGRSAWKKTKGHGFSIFIQNLRPGAKREGLTGCPREINDSAKMKEIRSFWMICVALTQIKIAPMTIYLRLQIPCVYPTNSRHHSSMKTTSLKIPSGSVNLSKDEHLSFGQPWPILTHVYHFQPHNPHGSTKLRGNLGTPSEPSGFLRLKAFLKGSATCADGL